MIDIWIVEMRLAGFGNLVYEPEALREIVTTQLVEGGCFGDPGSYRSAEDTLMGFNFPAFGLTNKAWATAVIEQYSGE